MQKMLTNVYFNGIMTDNELNILVNLSKDRDTKLSV